VRVHFSITVQIHIQLPLQERAGLTNALVPRQSEFHRDSFLHTAYGFALFSCPIASRAMRTGHPVTAIHYESTLRPAADRPGKTMHG
jgi:hypothetical protein